MERTWSSNQNGVFDFTVNGQGNAVVVAVAGSGKTTTICEAIRRLTQVHPHTQSIFLAFGKANAEDLKRRGVNARTFHSLCYMPVLKSRKQREVTKDKVRRLIDEHLGDAEARMYGPFIAHLVDIAKQVGIGCLINETEQAWLDIIDHHDLELTHEQATLSRAIYLARQLLEWNNQSQLCDFADLLYFAVKDGIALPKFDFVFVDEAQDTNAIRRAVLRKIMREDSRLIAVGDPAQAIFGFQGADSDSLDLIVKDFNCITLPLTVSYRCPQAVVRHARNWVSHIEAAPAAVEGRVTVLDKWDPKVFTSGDYLICRTTAPLVTLAYTCLKNRVPVKILGREIGEGLKILVEKMKASGIERLQEKLIAYTIREVEKAIAKKNEQKAAAIQDKSDCVLCLIDSLPETERSIPALLRTIDEMFSDQGGVITFSTIHKAKGLEARRVFWLNSSKCPSKWARQEWQVQQERNLCYVATTRAIEELVLIEMKEDKHEA